MSTKNDIHHNQFLQINLELKKNIQPSKELKAMVAKVICSTLILKSSEFAEISKSQLASKLVQIELWPNGHKRYFAPGTKQKWVEKT